MIPNVTMKATVQGLQLKDLLWALSLKFMVSLTIGTYFLLRLIPNDKVSIYPSLGTLVFATDGYYHNKLQPNKKQRCGPQSHGYINKPPTQPKTQENLQKSGQKDFKSKSLRVSDVRLCFLKNFRSYTHKISPEQLPKYV